MAFPVALFRTEQTRDLAQGDVTLGWSRLLEGAFEVQRVEGGHFTLFDPPYLATIGAQIERTLRRAHADARLKTAARATETVDEGAPAKSTASGSEKQPERSPHPRQSPARSRIASLPGGAPP